MNRNVIRSAIAALILLPLGLLGCSDGETSMARGDRLWAAEDYDGALAEYRLAATQSGGDEAALLRVAHGFARTGQYDRAREAYIRLLSRSPEYADQAVFDYLTLARRARSRGDRYGMAMAVESALELRSTTPLADLVGPLARYYTDNGDMDRALRAYERALAHAPPDSALVYMYEMGRIHEAQENCGEAMGFFGAYAREVRRGERAGEARWYHGRCAFWIAREERQEGQLTDALAHLDVVLTLGVPENLQDQAWFERGEILYALGRYDSALEAYRTVLELNPARTGQIVERAQRRIDDIRFRY